MASNTFRNLAVIFVVIWLPIFASGAPKGSLEACSIALVSSAADTIRGAGVDAPNQVFSSELAAAQIATRFYSHFGFRTDAQPGEFRAVDLATLNSREASRLQIVASFLGDNERFQEPESHGTMSDGSLVLTKFNRSFKMKPPWQKSNGQWVTWNFQKFDARNNIYSVYEHTRYRFPAGHPWLKVNRADVLAVLEQMKTLTDSKIATVVDSVPLSRTDASHLKAALSLRRDTMLAHLIKLFPQVTRQMTARQFVDQVLLGHEQTPAAKLDTISFLLSPNIGNIRERLRQSGAERSTKASRLPVNSAKFKSLTDEQLKAQWGGKLELDLPVSEKIRYLGKVKSLKRGDKVTLTRTLSLSRKDLAELLKTRLYVSHFLHMFNFDFEFVESMHRYLGTDNLPAKWDHNVGSGGAAISTTYAYDGWSTTRPNKPLIYNPQANRFDLQVWFKVPVEALVVNPTTPPKHVLDDPSGFGFVGTEADKESEISFMDLMLPEWIETNFDNLLDMFKRRTYPRETVNPATGQYDP